VEELAPFQRKEETTSGLSPGAVGASATFRSSVLIGWKKNWRYACGLLKMISLKEGAM
jgi:hypothetical protein